MAELKRIGWKDEPDETTPIDSGNLKAMENNVEDFVNEMSYDGLKKSRLKITEAIKSGTAITIPLNYKVGLNTLDVFLNGEKLLLSSDEIGTEGHFLEVGASGTVSNQIKLTTDWNLEVGDYLDFVARGAWN